MVRILSILVTLTWLPNCFGLVQFQVTDVSLNWTGFVDDSSGVVSWTVTSADTDGNVLTVSDIRSVGHDLFDTGSASVGIGGSDMPTFSFTRGVEVTAPEPAEIAFNGSDLFDSELQGSLEVLGDENIAPPFSPQPGAIPGDYIPQSGVVSDLPVDFNIDFLVFGSDTDSDPLYQISGSGDGTAEVSFATIAPSSHDRILQTGASFELGVASPNAVPEPHSLSIWGLLVVCVSAAVRGSRGNDGGRN